MIIPVVYSLNPVANNKMYTWVFIKAVSFAKKHYWPVIAQEQYFDSIDEMKGFFSENLLEHFEYDPICMDDLDKIIPIRIPKSIEKAYVKNFPSQTDAYLASIRESWVEMERFFEEEIQNLEKSAGEKIEAFITLPNNKFLENVAKKRNIPVIHFEWGPFRPKAYRKTAYFSFENIVTELEKRYNKFLEDHLDEKVPIFTKKEILAFFLEKDYLHYLFVDKQPTYEMGIATGYTTIGEYSAYNMVSMMELQTTVSEYFSEQDVCWRMHPEDPYHAQLDVKNKSQHESTIDFILDCKRVLSLSSNMIYEAMLYDKIGYDVGFSHYSFQGNSTLDGLKDKKPDIRFLNFVAFSYLIPYELLEDVDYIRYRLTNPSEDDIYNFHLNYYLNRLGLKRKVVEEQDRLHSLLRARGYEKEQQVCQQKKQNVELEISKLEENNQSSMIEAKQTLECLICNCIQMNELLMAQPNSEQVNQILQQQQIFLEKVVSVPNLYRTEQRMQVAILYLDFGQGFQEKDKLFAQYEIIDQEYKAKFQIPDGVKVIRFDPCECGERMLYFTDLRINGKVDRYEAVNIKEIDGKQTFIARNPYFVLKDLDKKISISLKVYDLS